MMLKTSQRLIKISLINTLAVAAGVNESDENLGIMIDAYGAGKL